MPGRWRSASARPGARPRRREMRVIAASYTAAPSEAFVGVNRLRLATEGAARTNIQDAIGQIGALTLP